MAYYTLCDECLKKGNSVGFIKQIVWPEETGGKCHKPLKPLPGHKQTELDVCPDFVAKEAAE